LKLISSGPTEEFPYPHLTGELDNRVPIVTAEKKEELLKALAAEHSVPLSQTLCVGDGANDLKMLHATGSEGGLAVAFRAKDKVQKEAPNRLNSESLVNILYLLGKDSKEVEELIREDYPLVTNDTIRTTLMPGMAPEV
jgi:phosphoserine phosphatase